MSGMGPYMISWTWNWFGLFGWVLSKWVFLGCGSVTVKLRDAIEIIIRGDEVVIYILDWLRHRVNHCFLQVKLRSQAFLVDSPHVIFSPTCWVATISLLKLASIVALDWINVGIGIKSTSRTKKKEARHASPLVVPVEATYMLQFPPLLYSVLFLS
jgi:hypothetical protein